MACNVCVSLEGEKKFSPGPIIYTGKFWIIYHAYPVSVRGWLVIILKRHVESLHDLTKPEWEEMQILQNKAIQVLHEVFFSEKEYLGCFSETEKHLHIHVIPTPKNLSHKFRGYRIFALLNVNEGIAITKKEVSELSNNLITHFKEVGVMKQ
jgi:diadenosine tetraphosphate (Ap4A) HIT family hydrolase